MLTLKVGAMRINGNLLKPLANKLYNAAAYILNQTSVESLNWNASFEAIWLKKPLVSYMRRSRCLAYALNRGISKGDKTESHKHIGHLVGYQGTNVFRIWLPASDEVFMTCNLVLNYSVFYNNLEKYTPGSTVAYVAKLLQHPENLDIDLDIDELHTNRQRMGRNFSSTSTNNVVESEVGAVSSDHPQSSIG